MKVKPTQVLRDDIREALDSYAAALGTALQPLPQQQGLEGMNNSSGAKGLPEQSHNGVPVTGPGSMTSSEPVAS